MTAEAKVEFDRDRATQYNLNIRQIIPGYEALHAMALSLLQVNLPSSARLLIVGSGTGREIINFCNQEPGWYLTGVDPAEEMIKVAHQELASRGLLERVNLYTGYLDSLPETEPMDAATLMLVMHFVPDDGSKLQLLTNIARRLKPGAEMILADLYGDLSLPYFAEFRQAWTALYFSQLDDETRAKEESNFLASIDNSIYFVTEARMIELLHSAGFVQVDKFYNAFLFGGWTAKLST